MDSRLLDVLVRVLRLEDLGATVRTVGRTEVAYGSALPRPF
ncbi:hypothetical protein [Streptomyces sp. NBC_01465]|nr:hypothetical protein [Streptomyces sp. NBC_01465]